MKKEAYEFRRDIVSGSVDQRSGKIMAEKLDAYFEQKLKAKVFVLISLLISLAKFSGKIALEECNFKGTNSENRRATTGSIPLLKLTQ